MKATLTFTLPDEQAEFELALKGGKYAAAIEDVRNAFREKFKYSEKQHTTWGDARDLLLETLNEALKEE